ncbi:MAG: hemerythrin domain-containing protein [Deltaproteobacteria bacterium]|nr:hemerythrin domain-containing protein [Deltaproteobacteria bacterium]
MPVTLGIRRCQTGPGDSVDALLECHDRIRRFVATARRLAGAPNVPAEQITEAAASVRRYFTEDLPLHSTDEDASVAPRLLALTLPVDVREAVQAMTGQHDTLHETIRQLSVGWAEVAHDAAALPGLASTLSPLSATLDTLFGVHLAMEENTVFPAIRALLPAAERDAILVEIRARRDTRRTAKIG